MFIGREKECARLRNATLAKKSLLIWGPAQCGKSTLIGEVIASLPEILRTRCLLSRSAGPPHDIWMELIRALANAGDSFVLSRVKTETGTSLHLDQWLKNQTSLRLRGILHRATRTGDYFVFLDPPVPLPEGVYRTLQAWVWSRHTPVYLTARGCGPRDAGKASRLFWHDDLRLCLAPLDDDSANQLLDRAVNRYGLGEFADNDFREFVLVKSGLIPGTIIRLCELASSPDYRYEGHLKLGTLAVDFLLLSKNPARTTGGKASRH